MDLDPRDTDDPRDRDGYGRELSRGSRGGLSNPRERVPLDARDIFTRDLELPRGHEPSGSPLQEPIFSHLCWYFERLGSPPTEASAATEQARFEKCRRAFSTDRYTVLYRRWRQEAERALATASSPVVGQVMESGAGKIEPLVLAHAYSHLAPQVGAA